MTSINGKRRRIGDDVVYFFRYLCAALSVVLLAGIIIYVFVRGIGQVNWEFLTSETSVLRGTVGIAGNLLNTLYIIIITMLIATPVGVGAAVYLNEYAKPGKLVSTIEFATETLAGTIRLAAANDNDNVRVYRYGGDEFIMIIPDGTEDDALSFIERWNKIMEPIQKDSKIPISASVGYACGRYADINKIICEADEKMYENNRVRRD